MTVSENTNPKVQYEDTFIEGQELPIPFPYVEREDIKCLVNNELIEYNTDYTVFNQTLTLLHPYGQAAITLFRETPLDQQAEFPQNNRFNSAKLNASLDKICMQQQEQEEALGRSLKPPISAVNFDGTLPTPEGSRALKINADASGFEMSEYDPDEAMVITREYKEAAEVAAEEAEIQKNQAAQLRNETSDLKDEVQTTYENNILIDQDVQAKYEDIQQEHIDAVTAIQAAQTAGTNAVEEAQNTAETSIDGLRTAAEQSISSLKTGAENDIRTLKTSTIADIQSLGIFMEDNRLFYFDSQGIKREFRNDFGGIAPMSVKHKDIQKVEDGFALTWTDPDDSIYQENVYCTWQKTVIVRKLDEYPESPWDGDIIYTETIRNAHSSEALIDNVDNTLNYKYRAFPCSINNVYSQDNKNKFGVWVYAFTELDTESNPAKRITYLEDNEHFKPNYMDYTNDIFRYEDWKDSPFYSWEYIRPCMLNADGTILEYLDPNDHSRTIDGAASHVSDQNCGAQAMVEKRKIFKKVVINGNYRTVYFSNEKLDDDYECYPCLREDGTYNEFYYTPMFHGSLVGNKMVSLAGGRAAMSGKNAQQEIDAARLNGAGWDTEVWADIDMEVEIFKLLFKNTDSQTVLGQGVIDSSNALSGSGVSGRTIAKGINYGTNGTNFPVKFRYRENFWAYQWQRFRGLIYINNIPYVKMTKHRGDGSTTNDYNITGSGYIACTDIPAVTGTSGGYISATKSNKYGQFSTVVSGSSSTYLCDGRWFATGTMYPFRGGRSGNGALCGAFYLHSGSAASDTYWSVGAALSYKPL